MEAILKAPGAVQQLVEAPFGDETPLARQPDEFLDSLGLEDVPVWKAVFEEADDHCYGLGSTIQDYEAALKLYKQAARLGAVEAYLSLGKMYRDGEGCVQSNAKAVEYFKEGARRGDTRCYAEMAELFLSEGHATNAQKCWDRYFAAPSGDVGLHGCIYFIRCREKKWPVAHAEQLRKHFPDLQRAAESLCTIEPAVDTPSLQALYKDTKKEIERLFGPR